MSVQKKRFVAREATSVLSAQEKEELTLLDQLAQDPLIQSLTSNKPGALKNKKESFIDFLKENEPTPAPLVRVDSTPDSIKSNSGSVSKFKANKARLQKTVSTSRDKLT